MAKFKDHAKVAGYTVAEVAVVGGSMLLTKKFLDFETLFKNQIAADPKYKDKFWMKHEGGIKLVAGALAASYVKNPWLKMVLIGVAVGGFIQEVRVLTTKADGSSFFDQIGQPKMGADNSLDQMMKEAADRAQQELEMSGVNSTKMYPTAVGKQMNSTRMYPTAVGLKRIPGLGNDNPGSHAVGLAPMMKAA